MCDDTGMAARSLRLDWCAWVLGEPCVRRPGLHRAKHVAACRNVCRAASLAPVLATKGDHQATARSPLAPQGMGAGESSWPRPSIRARLTCRPVT
jgi:hypothetical protein